MAIIQLFSTLEKCLEKYFVSEHGNTIMYCHSKINEYEKN